jgi:glycosyltransferase involved in cell wall biosynthesis
LKPLVSILIPAYNSQRWIADAIRSALAQTYEPKEILVVDDDSTDQTLAIARRFESRSVRISTQEHQGAAAARNKAFSVCQGDYIQYLDSDDLLAPDKIERQMQAVNKCGNDRTLFSSEWGEFMFRTNRAKFVPTALWCDLSPVEFLLHKMEQNLYLQTSVWLVSRELSEAAGPWNTKLLVDDDGEYFCRVMLACDNIRFVQGAKTYWRRSGPTQLSYLRNSDKKKDSQLLSLKLHIQYLSSLEESQRVRKACLAFLQRWYPVFYPERPDLVAGLNSLAAQLQGKLVEPRLQLRYAWMVPLFGRNLAKRAQNEIRELRDSWIRNCDRAMLKLETIGGARDALRDGAAKEVRVGTSGESVANDSGSSGEEEALHARLPGKG